MDPKLFRNLVQCPICLDLPRDIILYQCVNGHVLCSTCKTKVHLCPTGRCQFDKPPSRNRAMENLIMQSDLEFSCRFASSGCDQAAKLSCLEGHESQCGYRVITCQYENCGKEIRVNLMDSHVENFHIKCKNADKGCDFNGEKYVLESHYETCDYRNVVCTFASCRMEMLAKELESHISLNHVPCKNSEHGCEFIGRKYDTIYHESKECNYKMIYCKVEKCSTKLLTKDLEDHMATYHNFCKFTNDGCSVSSTLSEIIVHEKNCDYRRVPCIDGHCDRKVIVKNLLSHVKIHHEETKWNTQTESNGVILTFMFRKEIQKQVWPIYITDKMDIGQTFVFHLQSSEEGSLLNAWVTILGHEDLASKYNVRISTMEEKASLKMEMQCKVFPVDLALRQVLADEDCFHLTQRQAKQCSANKDLNQEDKEKGYERKFTLKFSILEN